MKKSVLALATCVSLAFITSSCGSGESTEPADDSTQIIYEMDSTERANATDTNKMGIADTGTGLTTRDSIQMLKDSM